MNRFKFIAEASGEFFSKLNKDSTHQVSVEIDTVTWGEVADEFYHFLLGCGFVLKRQDLSDHFYEHNDYEGGHEL